MREIRRFFIVLLTTVMTSNVLFGQSELENFIKSETERKKLNKKELREYVSFLENISDSLLQNKSGTIVGLQSQLKEKKIRIISIENEIVKLKTLQSQLESEKSELESEKSELESEKSQLKSEKSELESEKSQLKSEKSELEKKLKKLSLLLSKNNEELNLLRKLNGIENDTSTNRQNIKEIGDGSVISVGELTLTPNGYKYQNKLYTGYLWNLKKGNRIEDNYQIYDREYYNSSGLYFGMVKDGVKDGIWVENKNGLVKITKYEKGKINNGFTLEIGWDLSHYLLMSMRKDGFKQDFVQSDKSKTQELYKTLCTQLDQVKNLNDLLILLDGYVKLNTELPRNSDQNRHEVHIKIDNYENGKKNGLSIDTKYIRDNGTYIWDLNNLNYLNGLLDSVSVRGHYSYGTSLNNTDITFFISKPDFISIGETDEYELENYKQGKKDGVQTYYKNGVLTLKEKYSEGELNGDKEVYKKGVVQSLETFSNGVLTLKKIYENGIIKEEHYCRGVKDSYGYVENFILKRVIYINGNLNETWYYKKNVGYSFYLYSEENHKITKH